MFPVLWLLAIALASIPYVLLILPPPIQFLGRSFGSYLKERGAPRRKLLVDAVAAETKKHEEQRGQLDEEWEKVEKARSSDDGQQTKDGDWDGIVGFFHPFWYVPL
jgi:hypothetical protein